MEFFIGRRVLIFMWTWRYNTKLFSSVMNEAYNFIKKWALAQVFSCEFCEIFKNTFFIEHLCWLLLKSSSWNDLMLQKISRQGRGGNPSLFSPLCLITRIYHLFHLPKEKVSGFFSLQINYKLELLLRRYDTIKTCR